METNIFRKRKIGTYTLIILQILSFEPYDPIMTLENIFYETLGRDFWYTYRLSAKYKLFSDEQIAV